MVTLLDHLREKQPALANYIIASSITVVVIAAVLLIYFVWQGRKIKRQRREQRREQRRRGRRQKR